jgi:hypothetical protein
LNALWRRNNMTRSVPPPCHFGRLGRHGSGLLTGV